jgi:hypothetical protein
METVDDGQTKRAVLGQRNQFSRCNARQEIGL